MRIFLCLFLLFGAGIALLVLPSPVLGIPGGDSLPRGLQLWRMSVSLFVIPALLSLAKVMRVRYLRFFITAWGLWLTFLSLWILLRAPTELPGATWLGLAFVTAVMTVSLGALLSAAMSGRPWKP